MYFYRSFYLSLLPARDLSSPQPLQTLEPLNTPPQEMRLPPLLGPPEPEQCFPPLSMGTGKTNSKYLREMVTFISLREMLTFISLREMLTFISLRSIKLATRQIPPRGKTSGPDTWPPIRFHSGKSRAQTQIPPRENLGPRNLGPDSSPGRNLGPGYSGPGSTEEKPRAQVLEPRFPGYRSPVFPPEPMPLCSNPPLSLSSSGLTMVQLGAPLLLGITSMASCCRSLRESCWRFPPYLAHKSSPATRWTDAMVSSGGVYPPRSRVLRSGHEVARRLGVEWRYSSATEPSVAFWPRGGQTPRSRELLVLLSKCDVGLTVRQVMGNYHALRVNGMWFDLIISLFVGID